MVRVVRWLVVYVALVLVLTACAPVAAQPTATPTAAPTINPDAAQPLILVLPSTRQSTLIAVNRHYSAVVKHKGWNVDFYTVHESTSEVNYSSYSDYVCAQLASGVAKADGYFVPFYDGTSDVTGLDQAKAEGFLYDCVAAAPAVVPQYARRFSEGIAAGRYGLPLCFDMKDTMLGRMAFALRQSLLPNAPRNIRGYREVREVLEQLRANPGSYHVLCGLATMIEFWAREQGYYSVLADEGIYAKLDDPDARPVMLEDIPGCEEFLNDLVAWKQAGVLQFDYWYSEQSLQDVVGILDSANSMFLYLPASSPTLKDFTVFPLQTEQQYIGDVQQLAWTQASSANMHRELIVPAKSRRSADAMAFVQWLYEARENVDCVRYGQLGEDYTLQGDRITFANPQDNAYYRGVNSTDTWSGASVFSGIWPTYLPDFAPQNAEALRTAWPQPKLVAPWLTRVFDGNTLGTLENGAAVERRAVMRYELVEPLTSDADKVRLKVKDFMDHMRAGMTDERLALFLSVYDKLKAQK